MTKLRSGRARLSAPSARKNATTVAAASDAIVSSSASSAPCQYGLDDSASQKTCASKLASTAAAALPHVADRDLILRREPPQGAVLLELLDRRAKGRAELLVRRAVVDAEGVGLGEQIRDRELPGMLLLLVRPRRVLGQNRVRPADQELRHRVGVAGIALQRELRPSAGLELLVERLEVLLVLRPCLHRNRLP